MMTPLDKTAQKEFCKNIGILIGCRIRNLRLEKGINNTKFSKLVDISKNQMYKYECGHDRISMGRLVMICSALNCNLDYFFEPFNNFEQPAVSTPYIKDLEKLSRKHLEIINQLIKDLIPINQERGNE